MSSASNNIAIRVSHLSKQYKLGGPQEPYHTFRDAIVNSLRAPLKVFHKEPPAEGFWALKDVSFEVEKGEVVGIIGRNGAGKSTLLKILSRITSPTEGTVELHGRVGSLLEVGTGFHPELTGRENIYLSGSILGMKRKEIDAKLDEIVKFSEIEKFLDTPVKRYSSGMYVRLAFAVAAHLEPEILLVDEVLAVGDAAFQKKCLGKMGDVAKEGRTVIFVSHSMAAVQQLCQSGILLDAGKTVCIGEIGEVIKNYLQRNETNLSVDLGERKDRSGSQWLKFTKVAFYNTQGEEINSVFCGQNVSIRFFYRSQKKIHNATVVIVFNINTPQGFRLANLHSEESGSNIFDIYNEGFFECDLPKFNLRSDTYYCELYCAINGEAVDFIQNAFKIDVTDGDYYHTGKLDDRKYGCVLIDHTWSSSSNTSLNEND